MCDLVYQGVQEVVRSAMLNNELLMPIHGRR
jgi:hypothetical protein